MKRVWWETIYRIRNEFRIESLDSRSVRNDSFSLCSPRWLSVVEIERKITFKSVEFSSGSVRNRFSFSSELIRTERLFFFENSLKYSLWTDRTDIHRKHYATRHRNRHFDRFGLVPNCFGLIPKCFGLIPNCFGMTSESNQKPKSTDTLSKMKKDNQGGKHGGESTEFA